MAMTACSREEPQPKFLPATTNALRRARAGRAASSPSKTWSPKWSQSCMKRAGMMTSVLTLAPKRIAMPRTLGAMPAGVLRASWSKHRGLAVFPKDLHHRFADLPERRVRVGGGHEERHQVRVRPLAGRLQVVER